MDEINRRNLMKTSVAAALGASVTGVASGEDTDSPSAPLAKGDLKRFATTAFGAEVTGPFVLDNGSLIFSLQHPTDPAEVDTKPQVENDPKFRDGAIGYVSGFQFDADGNNNEFDELSIPKTKEQQGKVRVAEGEYELLATEQQPINGGKELLGVPQTPDEQNLTGFDGSRYSQFGNDPDMNQFVTAPDSDAYDGYLFTNFEQSPGSVARIPITINDDGSLSADTANTTNLDNYENLRKLGGTRINCYGDLSPWGTPLSAEEEYSHARVSLTNTVSDMVENNGVGRRGGSEFWNRPDPSAIQGKVGDYFGSSWYVQGFFALAGVELLAYYLGAEPVDQATNGSNDTTPIRSDSESGIIGNYPNRYRYGYIVDFRQPTERDPENVEPIKYYVMGRAAWEAPDVQSDRRTVYLTSDGANKAIYKFVADEPIDRYGPGGEHHIDDLSGTLYAPKVTNKSAAKKKPLASVDLEIEWLKLGSGTNGEIEEWIKEYDGIDQIDYLETHASTDWRDDLDQALLEADMTVVESGNQNYISDQEIVEWADQYESRGPDGVDASLRKVPFLETRAAAKEIGATVEFRKAEGIDSRDDAGPGDYIYIGLSEINDGLADDEGNIQMQRVDGGAVFRAELEEDYNISTLEPVIVGPDGTESPTNVADNALLNIDNTYVLEDGRVLCCEDADQFSRSYPNDGLYVFDPESPGS